jgi:hypothetical protein
MTNEYQSGFPIELGMTVYIASGNRVLSMEVGQYNNPIALPKTLKSFS